MDDTAGGLLRLLRLLRRRRRRRLFFFEETCFEEGFLEGLRRVVRFSGDHARTSARSNRLKKPNGDLASSFCVWSLV